MSKGKVSLRDMSKRASVDDLSSPTGSAPESGRKSTEHGNSLSRKSSSSSSPQGGKAWATSRHQSIEEKRALEIAEAVKQKKAAFALFAPKLQNIESRQFFAEWDRASINEDVVYKLEVARGMSTEFKELYSGDKMEYTVTELSPGVSYSVRVQATTSTLSGDWSPVATVKTKPAPPDTPGAPRMAQRGRNNLSLKWAATVDNGSPITAYILQWDQGVADSELIDVYEGTERQCKVSEKLKPGHGYTFRLRAVNDIGTSEFSPTSIHYTAVGAPAAPDAPELAKCTSATINVEWKPPSDNGGDSRLQYKLEMDDPAKGYGFKSYYNDAGTSHTCEGLEPMTTYKFRVSASNYAGSSKPSEVASYQTRAAPPGPPQNLKLQGQPQAFSFSAEWAPPRATGGDVVDSYCADILDAESAPREVYRGQDTHCQVSGGLVPGKGYMFQVHSITREGGVGPACKAISVKLPPTVPGSPSTPYVSGRAKSCSVVLAWGPPEFTGGADIASYTLERAGEGSTDFQPVYNGSRTTCNVPTLQPGMTYKFRVQAANSAGKGMFSPECLAKTGAAPPAAPANITVSPVLGTAVRISWEAASAQGTPVREYFVEQQSDSEFIQVYRGKDLSCEVRGLKASTSYSFRVLAASDAGQGPWSMLSSGKTMDGPPSAVGKLSLVNSTSEELTVSWPTPASNGQPVTHYCVELVGANPQRTQTETSTQATLSDLKSSAAHKIRVQAVNRVGSGPFSPVLTASTRAARPSPPTLELAGRYHNALKLRWNARQGCDYRLQISTPEQDSYETIYTGSSLSHKVTSLEPASHYRLRVCAMNEAGTSDYSPVQSLQTTELPPPPPKELKLVSTSLCEESADVCWHPIVSNGRPGAGYSMSSQLEVQCMEDGGEYRTVSVGDCHTQSHTLHSLKPGTKHSVRVRAREVSGVDGSNLHSSFSKAVTFTTPLSADLSKASPAASDNKADRRKSPKVSTSSTSASPSEGASSASSGGGSGSKVHQRYKKPPKVQKSTPAKAEGTMSADQRQAIFAIVLFVLVAVLLSVAGYLYLM